MIPRRVDTRHPMKRTIAALTLACLFSPAATGRAADEAAYTRQEDVVYGRKYGTALTMDVFKPVRPRSANGAGVVVVVSGGYVSSHESVREAFVRPLTDRGYTVFAVVHG